MVAVLLTIHILVCVAMIGVILLQRSEGGGLGLGSGGGVGGLMTGRGAANALTRTTVIFATIFISTSIALALVAKRGDNNPLAPTTAPGSLPSTTLPAGGTMLLPKTTPTESESQPSGPSPTPVPATPAPATPAPANPSGAQPAPAPAEPAGGGN
jgi:preprotein translocase subunit SecG